MDKRYLSPLELLHVATQHATSADLILRQVGKTIGRAEDVDALTSITSLMYLAFQLTLKAYCLHDHRPTKEYKNLIELVHLNPQLGFSNQDLILLKTLSRQQAFIKGISYDMWDDQQQLHVFCEKILSLYERVHGLMPIELHSDYL